MTCNTYDSPSTKFSTMAITAEQAAAAFEGFDTILAKEADPALKYTTSVLVNGIITINQITTSLKAQPRYLERYSQLYARLEAGAITLSEFADFLDKFAYTEAQVIYIGDNYTTPLPITTEIYLDNLNTYYTQSFGTSITGGLCSLFSGILGSLSQLFSAFNSIKELIAELSSIKDLLHKLVDSIKEKMLKMLDNFKQMVASFGNMVKQFGEKIRKVAEFFSDLNMQKIKDKITSLIQGIASKFAELTPEVISYLLFRFCQLTNVIEQFMQAPMNGLRDSVLKYQQGLSILTNMSNGARLNAVLAGAFRMSDNDRNTMRTNAGALTNSNSSLPSAAPGSTAQPQKYYTRPFSEQEIAWANEIKSAKKDDIRSGNYGARQYLDFAGCVDDEPDERAYSMLSVDILIIAIRIGQKFGKRLYINCGYRSPETNARLYEADPLNVAKDSYHISGLAMDISMTKNGIGNTVTEREDFIQLASQEGAGGIGTYPTFIHIDVGPRRKWRSSKLLLIDPLAHWNTLLKHEADELRNGATTTEPPTADRIDGYDSSEITVEFLVPGTGKTLEEIVAQPISISKNINGVSYSIARGVYSTGQEFYMIYNPVTRRRLEGGNRSIFDDFETAKEALYRLSDK